MRKALTILFLIFLFFGVSNCATTQHTIFSKKYNTDPRESFVYISTKRTATICNGEECNSRTMNGSASGVIIKRSHNASYILTAAHVCDSPSGRAFIAATGGTLVSEHKAVTLFGKSYKLEILNFNHITDICLMRAEGLTSMPPIPRAKTKPKAGDKVINIAAPLGVFETNVVPIMTGVYIGDRVDGGALFALPAAGGSSGSMILNADGELISILFAVHIGMNQLTIGTSFEEMTTFIHHSMRTHEHSKMIRLIAHVIQKGIYYDPRHFALH